MALDALLCIYVIVKFSAKRINLFKLKEQIMKMLTKGAFIVLVVGALSACSNMSQRDKNTAAGAGIGGVAGAVLTGGSGIGTAGGAAVGGVIGNQIKK
jgi:osmotically inducible lipoprotein OsmB